MTLKGADWDRFLRPSNHQHGRLLFQPKKKGFSALLDRLSICSAPEPARGRCCSHEQRERRRDTGTLGRVCLYRGELFPAAGTTHWAAQHSQAAGRKAGAASAWPQ